MQNRVMCYRNLHKKCWSVKEGNKPVRHYNQLVLTDCSFKVWEGGRQRVIREQKKFVCAFACGRISPNDVTPCDIRVSFNPYKAGHFYICDTGVPIHKAKVLYLSPDGKVYANLGIRTMTFSC